MKNGFSDIRRNYLFFPPKIGKSKKILTLLSALEPLYSEFSILDIRLST
jgi:hypothetical protein